MEMVRHDHKFVEKIFPLSAIVIEHVNQQLSGTGGLQKALFLPSGGSHKERAIAGNDVQSISIANGNRHPTPAPKGAFLLRALAVSLKRYPDTNLTYSGVLQ